MLGIMWLGVRQALALTAATTCAWCALGACSGGYPLPPTACDEYCNATLGDYCPDYYDPAGCVSACEENHVAPPECRKELDVLINCYQQHPDETSARCRFTPDRIAACATETYLLQTCANTQKSGTVPGYPNR